jgi:hypothetical protein
VPTASRREQIELSRSLFNTGGFGRIECLWRGCDNDAFSLPRARKKGSGRQSGATYECPLLEVQIQSIFEVRERLPSVILDYSVIFSHQPNYLHISSSFPQNSTATKMRAPSFLATFLALLSLTSAQGYYPSPAFTNSSSTTSTPSPTTSCEHPVTFCPTSYRPGGGDGCWPITVTVPGPTSVSVSTKYVILPKETVTKWKTKTEYCTETVYKWKTTTTTRTATTTATSTTISGFTSTKTDIYK